MIFRSVLIFLFPALCSLSSAFTLFKTRSGIPYYDEEPEALNEETEPEKLKNREYYATGTVLKGFRKIEDRYFFSDFRVPWRFADAGCTLIGMHLVTILNKEEQDDITAHINANNLNPKDGFDGYWIGGYRLSRYGDWHWTSNDEIIDYNSTLWLPGEPNDIVGEDCIELKKDTDGKLGLNNFHCVGRRRFICQRPTLEDHKKYSYNQMSSKDSQQDHEELGKNNFEEIDASEEDITENSIVTEESDNNDKADITTTEISTPTTIKDDKLIKISPIVYDYIDDNDPNFVHPMLLNPYPVVDQQDTNKSDQTDSDNDDLSILNTKTLSTNESEELFEVLK